MLEQLPAPSRVGKTKVGGNDLNKARLRWVIEAVIALSDGFTASELANQVQALGRQKSIRLQRASCRLRPEETPWQKHRAADRKTR